MGIAVLTVWGYAPPTSKLTSVRCQDRAREFVATNMRTTSKVFLLAMLAALALAPGAFAQSIPPGNSGADQYTEGVPDVGGDKPAGGNGEAGGGGGAGGSISNGTLDALASAGADGALAGAALGASSPTPSGSPGERGSTGGAEGADDSELDALEDQGLGSALGTVAQGSDQGMGIVLPLILALVALGAVGLLVAQRARRSGSG